MFCLERPDRETDLVSDYFASSHTRGPPPGGGIIKFGKSEGSAGSRDTLIHGDHKRSLYKFHLLYKILCITEI